MNSVKGTKTEQNLLKSFAGESQAKKEGYVQISQIFEETANQEKEHAKRFFSFLEGGALEITAAYPAGITSNTLDNLKAAAGGEHEEWTELYPEFAEVARQEGFEQIAKLWENVSVAEKQHEKRYNDLAANIVSGKIFKREAGTVWRCINCGFIYEGDEAPQKCPACLHPQAYFELFGENY